jgi:hypothetical protein
MHPSEVDEHRLYPQWPSGFKPEDARHERQVRYLRDALTVLLDLHEVTGGEPLLGWDGEQTCVAVPDVLVWWTCEGERGHPPVPRNPHPNPHPREKGRRVELVVDVSSRGYAKEPLDPRSLRNYGVGAYLHFSSDSGVIAAWRWIDNDPVQVRQDDRGRHHFADLSLSFGTDNEGFLRVYDFGGGEMPRYDEIVKRPPSPRMCP